MRQAARRLSQHYDGALAPEGLKTSQYSVLSALACWSGERPTVQALADALALDRTTLGHNLRPLERAGLLTVEEDRADRRQRRVALTEAGRAKRAACLPLWRAAQDTFDARFGTERSTHLRVELAAIARDVDLGGRHAPEGTPDVV